MSVELPGPSECALITLCARAQEGGHRLSVLSDPAAERTLAALDYDFTRFRASPLTCCGLAVRSRVLDDWTRAFLSAADRPRVISLGCGLDHRPGRLGLEAGWLDVDLPVMEALWREHCDEGRARFVAASLDDEAWLAALPEGGDTVVIVEGVLMYLDPGVVERLFSLLRAHLPGAQVWADVLSPAASRTAALHPAVASTGNRFHSGWAAGESVPGYRLLEESSLFEAHPQRWQGWRALAGLPFVRDAWRLLRLGQ